MIIIKTTNGDVLINEKAIQRISHDKEKQEVIVFALDGGVTSPNIKDVEEVFYANDMQALEHRDKGSKVEKLEKQLEERMKWGSDIRKEYMEMQKERDQLKSEVEKLRNLVKTLEGINPTASAPKQKISLRATSPVGSDCTQAFDVDGCDGMTAISFIMAVMKNDPYVTIDIMRDGKYIWRGEFENNRLKKESDNTMPEDFNFLKVKSARAAGGWGQMSYNVKLYDSDNGNERTK